MSTKKTPEEEKYQIGLDIKDYATIDGIRSALESEKSIKDDILDAEYAKNLEELKKSTHVKKRQVYNEAMSKVPVMKESFANYGLSASGGKVKTEELRFNTALDGALAELDGILLSQSGNMASELSRAKLENLSAMLKELRSESTRIEQLLYQREQDKIRNALEARRIAAQEASVAVSRARAEQEALEYKNNAMLAAAQLVAGGAKNFSGNKYVSYLKRYASDYLSANGIDLETKVKVVPYNKNEEKDQNVASGGSIIPIPAAIRDEVYVLRHVNMSYAQKYDYYIRKGLDYYRSFEEAIGQK